MRFGPAVLPSKLPPGTIRNRLVPEHSSRDGGISQKWPDDSGFQLDIYSKSISAQFLSPLFTLLPQYCSENCEVQLLCRVNVKEGLQLLLTGLLVDRFGSESGKSRHAPNSRSHLKVIIHRIQILAHLKDCQQAANGAQTGARHTFETTTKSRCGASGPRARGDVRKLPPAAAGGRTVKFERVLSPHSLPHVAVINIMNQVRHIKVYQIVTSYFGLAQLITLDLIQLDRGTLS